MYSLLLLAVLSFIGITTQSVNVNITWHENVLPQKGDALLKYDVYHEGVLLDDLVFKVNVNNAGIDEQKIPLKMPWHTKVPKDDNNQQSVITLDIHQLCQQIGSYNLQRMRLRCYVADEEQNELFLKSESTKIDIFSGKVCGANCYDKTPLLLLGILFVAFISIVIIIIWFYGGLNKMSTETMSVRAAFDSKNLK